jgi:hypothetical protein
MFQHVSVWLDGLSPDQGAFVHALEWASRLRLPLRGAFSPMRDLSPYAEACHRKGVSWEVAVRQENPYLGVEDFFGPLGLCVFGQALPPRLREYLLRCSLEGKQTATLVCPDAGAPLSRVLVLNQGRDPAHSFLTSTARLCRVFQATPVVLTVARSEAEARLRQQAAQTLFTAHSLPGDFDFLVGCDLRTAVSLEARCRRCSHVFVERENASSWWRWLRGDIMRRLLRLADSLAFLSLPGLGPPVLADEQTPRIGQGVELREGERGAPAPPRANSLPPLVSSR